MDVAALTDRLHETSEHHGSFEAAYMDARRRGAAPEDAIAAAGRYMADVEHVIVSSA